MRVFACTTHTGYGAASVVVARDEQHARILLGMVLHEHDLRWRGEPELREIDTSRPNAIILRPASAQAGV